MIQLASDITRGALSSFFGKEISRDLIGHLRGSGMIISGPRSPTPGAPYTYVTTNEFLLQFGLETLRDLPELEALEDAGLLNRHSSTADAMLIGARPTRVEKAMTRLFQRDRHVTEATSRYARSRRVVSGAATQG